MQWRRHTSLANFSQVGAVGATFDFGTSGLQMNPATLVRDCTEHNFKHVCVCVCVCYPRGEVLIGRFKTILPQLPLVVFFLGLLVTNLSGN